MTNTVPTRFPGATGFCIGTGPSLTAEQIELIRGARARSDISSRTPHGVRVFGINDAYRICDFLDVLYAADYRWVEHHFERTVGLPCDRWHAFHKQHDPAPGWHEIPVKGNDGLSTDRTMLRHGQHSGYQIINLAYLMGCTTIALVGYDGHSGGKHFFGKHPTPMMDVETNYASMVPHFRSMAKHAAILNLNIVNATPGSAIDAFDRVDLAQFIGGLRI